MTTKNKKPKPIHKGTLPVPSDVRDLAEENMNLGDHGTLTNTIRVALREQNTKLKAEKAAAAAAHG